MIFFISMMIMMFCSSGRAQNIREDGTSLLLRNVIDTLDNLSIQLQDQEEKIKTLMEDQEEKIKTLMEDQEEKIKTLMEGQQQLGRSLQQCSTKHQLYELENLFATDECQDGSHNCSDMATCTDALYQYKCSCRPGYAGDGFTCQDIDECTEGNFRCGTNEVCSNVPASYTCNCQQGYRKEGETCQDVDECRDNVGICGDNLICRNSPGNYTCTTCDKYFKTVGDICQGPVCESPSLHLPDLGCLTLVKEKMIWDDAKSKCQQMGMRLAEDIPRKHMGTLIQYFYPLQEFPYGWVGIRDGRWLTSGKEVKKEDWRAEEPNRGDQLCGYVHLKLPSIGLADYDCSDKDYALCQSLP